MRYICDVRVFVVLLDCREGQGTMSSLLESQLDSKSTQWSQLSKKWVIEKVS